MIERLGPSSLSLRTLCPLRNLLFLFLGLPLHPPKKQKSRKSSRPAADQQNAALSQPLAGGESSLGYNPHETFAVLAPLAIPHRGRPRKTRGLSGQVAETPPGPSRVRFEFAGRAHCREFTPFLVINPPLFPCQHEITKKITIPPNILSPRPPFLECGGSPPLFQPQLRHKAISHARFVLFHS